MKTSFNLMKNLNENALPKIKKTRILGENQENLKEYYKMKDNEHIIWDSEINYYDESYMEEIRNNQYQDYLDDFTEDSEEKPLDFETWYENYINDSGDYDWEILEDDLKENIFPQIDQQINHNCLILSGNYGSNYPDFRPSGEGGKLFTGTDDFRNYMAGFDRVCITTQNGILGAICNDHDGTVSGQFYTAPEDLTELAQLMGYKEEESNYGTIADDLDQDLANEYLEAQQLTQFMDKLVPIKDTITAYSVNESEKLTEKLNFNEIKAFAKKALEAGSDEELKNIASEIRYYSEPTFKRCVEIINGDGSTQYKAGQISDMLYQLNESEEHDLSKDILGDESNKRMSEDQRAYEKYLQFARDIKDGKNQTITLDSAKELLKNAYIKAKGYYSFEPEEIDKRIAKDIPDLFGNELDEEVIPNSFNMKCPKCGSSNYLEIDDGEDEDGTQHIILKCQDCGYEQKDELTESEESIKYNIYLLLGGDGVYNSKLVDTVESLEQAQDRVAELEAENGCGAYYEKVDSNGKPLEESVEVIDEQVVSDKLTEVKSQGNVYMLQDNDTFIVGEDYNKEENLIENAEIYENKEEADKDYFSRCEVTRDGKEVDPTEVNPEKEEPTEEA